MNTTSSKDKGLHIFVAIVLAFLINRIFLINFIDSILITESGHTNFDKNFTQQIGLPDYLAIAAFIALILIMLIAELRYHLFSGLISKYHDRMTFFLFVLTAATIFYAATYFQTGNITGDARQQITAADLLYKEFISGNSFPLWSYYVGSGTPFLQFYPIAGTTLLALLNIPINDPELVCKILLFISSIIASLAMFFLVKRLVGNNLIALAGSLTYSLNYFLFNITLHNGSGISLFIALMPFPFLMAESLLEKPSLKNTILLSLILTALWNTHLGYTLFLCFFLLLWSFFRRSLPASQNPPINLKKLIPMATGITLSVAISAFHLIPILLERRLTLLYTIAEHETEFYKQSVNLLSLLIWGPFHFKHPLAVYIGYSPVLLGLIGFFYIIKKKQMHFLSIIIPLLFVIAFSWGLSFNILPGVNPLAAMKTPYRFIVFFIFFQSILASFGALYIYNHFKLKKTSADSKPYRVLAFILLIIIVDLVPLSLQSRFRKGEKTRYEKIYSYLSSRKPSERVIDSEKDLCYLLPRYGIQTPFLLFYEELPIESGKTDGYLNELLELINRGNLDDQEMSHIKRSFNIFNMGYVITDKLLEGNSFTQIYADDSRKLYKFNDKKPFPEVDANGNRIFSADLVKASNMSIEGNILKIDLDVISTSAIELPFSWYKHLNIYDNGKIITPIRVSDMGFPVVKLIGGYHAVEIVPYESRLRATCNVFSLAMLLVTVISYAAISFKKRRKMFSRQ